MTRMTSEICRRTKCFELTLKSALGKTTFALFETIESHHQCDGRTGGRHKYVQPSVRKDQRVNAVSNG